MFKTIGLITKPNDLYSEKIAKKLASFLKKISVEVLFYQQEIKNKAEIIIVLGGDGTFVATARTFVDSEIPLLGVNLGKLGFLTDIDTDEMFDSITEVMSGKYTSETRFLLETQTKDGNFVALNDVVVHRGNSPKMVNTDVYINNKFVNKGSADGLIISSPTGSTAYALSSGGPIIDVGVDAISLTYISPHAMTYRPFIFNANDTVCITLTEPSEGANIVLDGQVSIPFMVNENICIKKYSKKLTLIHPHNYDFFTILRNKLHWNK